jgi:hypothetical protein
MRSDVPQGRPTPTLQAEKRSGFRAVQPLVLQGRKGPKHGAKMVLPAAMAGEADEALWSGRFALDVHRARGEQAYVTCANLG